MTMFKPTAATTPEEYIHLVDEPRRKEFKQLHDFIRTNLPTEQPFIISGMIGYGKYHYKYASGREGDWALILLACQKKYFSLYVCATDGKEYLAESYKKALPKASIGKSCIRFAKITDIDLDVIKKMLLQAEKLGGMSAVTVA